MDSVSPLIRGRLVKGVRSICPVCLVQEALWSRGKQQKKGGGGVGAAGAFLSRPTHGCTLLLIDPLRSDSWLFKYSCPHLFASPLPLIHPMKSALQWGTWLAAKRMNTKGGKQTVELLSLIKRLANFLRSFTWRDKTRDNPVISSGSIFFFLVPK